MYMYFIEQADLKLRFKIISQVAFNIGVHFKLLIVLSTEVLISLMELPPMI